MGKLYDLVEFRNYLTGQLNHLSLEKPIQDKILNLRKIIRIFPQHADYCDTTIKDYLSLAQKNQTVINSICEEILRLDAEIDKMSTSMFNSNEYLDKMSECNIQGSFSNNLIISAELKAMLISKITEYCNFHYPALQINPRSKKWIEPMVAGDPLYLTHLYIDIIKDIIKSYPELYQNRLRLYEIKDRDFSTLPQAQFSFVMCWDYLNYISLEKVDTYVRQVWNLLRPGGCFMFSYSNCDLAETALCAESLACAYASSRWLKKLCNEIGYDICELKDFETEDAFNTHVSWAILKKPGELATVKKTQVMGQILLK